MLKPYVCVLCEKVIVAKDGDVPSLIGLMNKMILHVPTEAEIASNAVAPKEWNVFSIWDSETGDEQKEYILCTQVLYPNKTQFAEIARLKVPVEANKRSQMVVQLPGFPIGQIGFYTVRTWLEENDQMVVGPIEAKIELEIIRVPPPSPATPEKQ
jgi:hypothetical protein